MKKLVKEFTKRENGFENTLEITVDYNPHNQDFKLISIVTVERKYREEGNTIHFSGLTSRHDVTDVMLEAFPLILGEIDRIDWEEIYRAYRADNIGEDIEDYSCGVLEDSINADR